MAASPTSTDAPGGRDDRRVRPEELLEFTALSGLAVAEPVLTAFRDGADVFVLRGARPLDVIAFVAAVVLAPPLAAWVVLQVAGSILPSRRQLLRGGLLALFTAVVVIRALERSADLPRPLVVLFAFAVGLVLAQTLRRWLAVTSWLRILAVFPILLALVFVVTEPVSALVFDRGGEDLGPASIEQSAPVVMLVLDELPTASILGEDDGISAEQFPNLAAFAADATWYRNQTSVAPSTPEAVPAILTGNLPTSVDALPVVEAYPDNLFTALRGSYRMHVREGATSLCPDDVCPRDHVGGNPVAALLDDAVALWSDQLSGDDADDGQGEFVVRQSDPSAPQTFEGFLDGIEAGDDPVLDFHHALYPHQPWFHLPSGRIYDAPFVAEGLEPPNYTWTDDSAAFSGQQRHLLQARHADALVGRLIERLRSLDHYDDSLIVVTADHGAAFDQGEPVRGLSFDNAEQIMWTPLLVKAPGQTDAVIDERPMQSIDILPTIADHLGLTLPFETAGTSALGEEAPDQGADERVFFEWSLNTAPADDEGLVRIDGRRGYAAMLALPAPGGGDDPDLRFFRFGRHGDLVGRDVVDIGRGTAVDGTALLEQARSLRDVDPTRSPVPVYLSGEVPGDEPVDVAVAVNGVVGGWGHTEAAGTSGRQHFWAMVPPALLHRGGNDVAVFVVEGAGAGTRLAPVALPG